MSHDQDHLNALRQVTLRLDHLTLAGFSISGLATYVQIPELDVCFDMGECPLSALALDHVFLTHAHGDHARCLPRHWAVRRMLGNAKPACYFLPAAIAGAFADVIRAEARFESVRALARLHDRARETRAAARAARRSATSCSSTSRCATRRTTCARACRRRCPPSLRAACTSSSSACDARAMATIEVGIQIDTSTGVAFFGLEAVNRQLAAGLRIKELRPGGLIATKAGDGGTDVQINGCQIQVVFEGE